jgi:hypothetical protein
MLERAGLWWRRAFTSGMCADPTTSPGSNIVGSGKIEKKAETKWGPGVWAEANLGTEDILALHKGRAEWKLEMCFAIRIFELKLRSYSIV